MIKIMVNGKTVELEGRVSVLDLLTKQGIDLCDTFVGHNQVIVKREHLGDIVLQDGDIVEIIKITAGG
ncbi:MAG: sulfur carrier protein ThiS [Elusimicrobiota bacterium]|jgi:thiamine biosynthesis protein ThiS|nr:sulfur carrier protein ThiS [Elusimicrobiota bacterium]